MIMFINDEMASFVMNKMDGTIFNLSSYYNIGVDVGNLIPHGDFPLEYRNSDDFEMNYIPWLLTTKEVFSDFISIMLGDYYSSNSYVLFQTTPVTVFVIDCLMTLIRKRYGKTPFIVYSLEDMMKTYETSMSYEGIETFMRDKELYTYGNFNPENFNKMLEEAERYNGSTL